MTKDEKNTVATIVAVLMAITLGVGLGQGWPVWLWLIMLLALPAAGVALDRTVSRRRQQRRLTNELHATQIPAPPAPEPEQPWLEPLTNISLPSLTPDYRFLLSATIYWRATPNPTGTAHGNVGALARDAVVSRAAEILASARPEEHSVLGERLNAALGAVRVVPSGQAEAWAWGVSVGLPEEDQRRLDRLSEVRKEEQVWEHERNHERNVREYLGDDVLDNPGRAVVWWLARNQKQEDSGLAHTVENIGRLRRLTAAAQTTEVPALDEFERTAVPSLPLDPSQGDLFHPHGHDGFAQPNFVVGATPGDRDEQRLLEAVAQVTADAEEHQRSTLIARMAALFDAHDKHDVATALRERFSTQPPPRDQAEDESRPGEATDPGEINGTPPDHW